MIYRESIGHVNVKLVTRIRLELNISKTAGDRDLALKDQLLLIL